MNVSPSDAAASPELVHPTESPKQKLLSGTRADSRVLFDRLLIGGVLGSLRFHIENNIWLGCMTIPKAMCK